MQKKGFSMVEVLLVIAILIIIGTAGVFFINPSKRMELARNNQRELDIETIANALYSYATDNDGQFPNVLTGTSTEICRTTVATSTCLSLGLIDLSSLTLNGKYLVLIPVDPGSTSTTSTGYAIAKNAVNRIVVSAPLTENTSTLSIIR